MESYQQNDSAILSDLWRAGRYDYVEKEAREFLQADPNDERAHYYIARTLTRFERLDEAEAHVRFILSSDPDRAWYQLAAAVFHWVADRNQTALLHIRKAISLSPEEAHFYYIKASIHEDDGNLLNARREIETAHRLAPDDIDISRKWILLSGPDKPNMEDALRRLEELRESLKLDPESAETHNSLGNIYFNELSDCRSAEQEYRESIRLDPTEPVYAENLFLAVKFRSVLYRMLDLPRVFRVNFHNFLATCCEKWYGRVAMMLCFKLWLPVYVWLYAFMWIVWPLRKAYEWLLVKEIQATTSYGEKKFRLIAWLHHIPFWGRFGLFFAVFFGFFSGLFWLCGTDLLKGVKIVAWFCIVHFVLVLVGLGLQKFRRWLALRKRLKSARSQIAIQVAE